MINFGFIIFFILIEAMLLFINSFFDSSYNIINLLLYIFIFYVVFDLLIKINIFRKLLTSGVVVLFFVLCILFGIYKMYSIGSGFISSSILSISLLWFAFSLMLMLSPESTDSKFNRNKYWKDRLDEYENK